MALTEDRLRPEAAPEATPAPAADRARLRALRAERLARLRATPNAAPIAAPVGPGLAESAPPVPAAPALSQDAAQDGARGLLPDAPAGGVLPGPRPAPADLADPEALVAFLRALTGDGDPEEAPPAPRPAAEVLRFERPAAPAPDPDTASDAAREATPDPEVPSAAPSAPVCDLDRLPGVGPGLVWALRHAGITRLADLAPLTEADLATRLGPLGRLVPAATWIATARAAIA
jgi:predicted flap endonuclease-1-like 5' DNA nuclease